MSSKFIPPNTETHELRAKFSTQQTELKEFFDMFHSIAAMYLSKQHISKIRKLFEEYNETHILQIPINYEMADGRALAWTDERRAKISKLHAERHAANRAKEVFYINFLRKVKVTKGHEFKVYKSSVINGIDALAKILDFSDRKQYLRNRLNLKPDGQTFRLSITERLIVSTSKPIEDKPLHKRREEFEQTYYKKHGIWPNEDQIPDNLIKERPQTDAAGRKIRHF
jgi:hypothetical protein